MAPNLQLNKSHKLGKLLGEGAFGKVYAVTSTDSSNSNKWAAKIAPKPAKETKKKTSDAEVAYNRLHWELQLYSNHFRSIEGKITAKLPTGKDNLKVFYHDVGGNRCLIMERMECLFFDAIPKLVSNSNKKIELGKICAKLVDIVEAVHQATTHVLIDVKPDNFMLCQTSSKKWTTDSVAKALRLVDLGLAKPFGGVSRHVDNNGTKGVQGTPLYASIPNHQHNTPGRRDDIESMLYIIGELIALVNGHVLHQGPPFGKGDGASFLPWSQEKDDSKMGTAKQTQVTDIQSDFYSFMPKPAAKALYQCLELVRGYEFKTVPDYDAIRSILAKVVVVIPAAKKQPTPRKAAAKKQPTPKKAAAKKEPPGTSPLRRSTRRTAARDDEDDEATPPKKRPAKRSPEVLEIDSSEDESPPTKKPAAKRRPAALKVDSDVEMEDVEEEEESVEESLSNDESMSIESEEETASDKKKRRETIMSPRKAKPALAVVKVVSGPNKGEYMYLMKDADTIIVGSAPTKHGQHLVLSGDDNCAPDHCQLKLSILNKNVVSVEITDLKGGNHLSLNDKDIKPGKSMNGFLGNSKIQVGNTKLELHVPKKSRGKENAV